jgi:hypothetical protein
MCQHVDGPERPLITTVNNVSGGGLRVNAKMRLQNRLMRRLGGFLDGMPAGISSVTFSPFKCYYNILML